MALIDVISIESNDQELVAKLPSDFAPNYRLKFKKSTETLVYIAKKQ